MTAAFKDRQAGVCITAEDIPGINKALNEGCDVWIRPIPGGIKIQRLRVETIGRRETAGREKP